MIIIDVGAGDGNKCVVWLKKYKDALVYAFEPDPRQFKKLKVTKQKLKPQEQKRLKLFNQAVWNKNEERDYFIANDPSSSSLLPFKKENLKKWKYPPGRYYFKTEKIAKIKCVTLNKITKNEKIDIIDFLRIDAQGCTKQILEGLGKKKLRHVKEVFLKVHITDFDIYEGQSTRIEIEKLLKPCHFLQATIEPYSRRQEAWVRYHSDVWKRIRNSRIYNLL